MLDGVEIEICWQLLFTITVDLLSVRVLYEYQLKRVYLCKVPAFLTPCYPSA